MIKSWIAKIVESIKSSDTYPTHGISYLGKLAKALVISPYGYYSNSDEDTLSIVFTTLESSELKTIVGFIPKNRPTLSKGEVAIYRPLGDAIIKFLNNGNIEISTTNDIDVSCNNLVANTSGTVTINSTGSINLASSQDVNISATANVNISGSQINLN